MKTILLASLLTAAAIGIAWADGDDKPGKDWMPLASVASKLHDMGFDPITKIEAEDGVWKAKAFKGDEAYKIKLDPVSGKVVEQHREGEHHADKQDDGDHDD